MEPYLVVGKIGDFTPLPPKPLDFSQVRHSVPDWRLQVETIRQCPQSQGSVTDQLKNLIRVANKLGFYDAADFLKEYTKD